MKKFFSWLENFKINLVHTFFSLGIILFLTKRTKKFRVRKKSSCIILGNGPSLKNNIEQIASQSALCDLICVNDFAESDTYRTIRPDVYVFLDPYYWEDISEPLRTRREKLFHTILNVTDWEITVYAPFPMKRTSLFRENKNPKIEFRFFNNVPVQGFRWLLFYALRHGVGLPKAPNVIISALHYAINACYETIFLYGVDHSWHLDLVVKEDSKVYVAQKHFYDEHVDYELLSLSYTDVKPVTMDEIFLTWSNVFRGYRLMNEYARLQKVKVINRTKNSFIDAFPKE